MTDMPETRRTRRRITLAGLGLAVAPRALAKAVIPFRAKR